MSLHSLTVMNITPNTDYFMVITELQNNRAIPVVHRVQVNRPEALNAFTAKIRSMSFTEFTTYKPKYNLNTIDMKDVSTQKVYIVDTKYIYETAEEALYAAKMRARNASRFGKDIVFTIDNNNRYSVKLFDSYILSNDELAQLAELANKPKNNGHAVRRFIRAYRRRDDADWRAVKALITYYGNHAD